MNEEKQIEEMMKSICMDCRYFMRCNDDTMCDGRTLSETLKEICVTRKYAQIFYEANYRKQIFAEWIPHRFDKQGNPISWYCSNCKGIGNSSVYCSHCGAHMKGDE